MIVTWTKPLYFYSRERKVLSRSRTVTENSTMMNRNGMVTKIRTRIRTDPFKNNYDLVGKELGR